LRDIVYPNLTIGHPNGLRAGITGIPPRVTR
jgi:hypothetical protein